MSTSKAESRPLRALAALAMLAALLPAAPARGVPTTIDDLVRVGDRYRSGDTFQVIVDVLANDHDPAGVPLEIAQVSDPVSVATGQTLGSLAQLDDGTLIYTLSGVAAGEPLESVSFTYRLRGGSRTARVDLVPASSSPVVIDARDDVATTDAGVAVTIPVLDNDVGADFVQSVGVAAHGQTAIVSGGAAVRYTPAAGYDGGDSFTYTAASLVDPTARDTAVVSVSIGDDGPPPPVKGLPLVLRDTFSGMSADEPLAGRLAELPGTLAWAASATLVQRSGAITTAANAPARVLARLPFDPDGSLAAADFEVEARLRVVHSNWVAVGFSHGEGLLFADPPELDLWLLLKPSGELIVHSRGIQPLTSATPAGVDAAGSVTNPAYGFDATGFNDVRLRFEEDCPAASPLAGAPCVSAWVNGTRVIDRIAYHDDSGVQPAGSPRPTITQAELYVNRGSQPAQPGDIGIDDFTVRAGEVSEPHVDLFDGSRPLASGDTLTAGPVAAGSSETVTLTVRNTGDAPLTLGDVQPPTAGSGWQLTTSVPGLVAIGETRTIGLSLSSATPGTKTAELAFSTDDPGQPRLLLHLEGEVVAASAPPVARNDHLVTPAGQSLDVVYSVLLANDSGDGIAVDFITSEPQHGTWGGFGPGGQVYVPDSGYVGLDSFEYEIHDSQGATAQAMVFLTVDGPPTAVFDVYCTGLRCVFDAAASSDLEDGSPAVFQWSFGDGGTGSGEAVSHDYAASGDYTATLTVNDSLGQTAETSRPVVLDLPPVASFTASCSARTCGFDALTSQDDRGIVAYAWSFGDGQSSGGPPATHAAVTHVYEVSGDYEITLEVTDTAGQIASTVRQVSIDLPPTAVITVTCESLTCGFDANHSTDDFGITAFTWSFGDGSAEMAGETVEHSFAEEAVYRIRLTVADEAQQTDFTEQDVEVRDEELFLLLLVLDDD